MYNDLIDLNDIATNDAHRATHCFQLYIGVGVYKSSVDITTYFIKKYLNEVRTKDLTSEGTFIAMYIQIAMYIIYRGVYIILRD